MHEPIVDGPSKGHLVSEEELQAMLDDYYLERDWDDQGRPTVDKLEELGIGDLAYW